MFNINTPQTKINEHMNRNQSNFKVVKEKKIIVDSYNFRLLHYTQKEKNPDQLDTFD